MQTINRDFKHLAGPKPWPKRAARATYDAVMGAGLVALWYAARLAQKILP